MENRNIVMLKDVRGYKRNSMMKVKIATLWRKIMNGTKDKTYRLDMILMDEMGTFMYCQCYHKVLHNFQKMLQLDETLYITNPSVSKESNTKYVKHDHKLSLSDRTTVKKCDNWEGVRYSFNFAKFKSILQKNFEKNTIIDFIGYVRVCYKLEYIPKKNGVEAPKINFKLLDLEGTEVEASLWDEKAIQMESFMNEKDRDKFVFIIVQFGQVSDYEGKMTLSSSFDASRSSSCVKVDNMKVESRELIFTGLGF
ncbi:hypothetical protein M8C21_004269 [Ambrosia artemisiifolia]|uniref:Nucleic acid-binding, OB-fold protein n=1 Tax=Ambrosia artemisiifolia TaxID=4212 RepID=A0AAD5G843_AMBAR|nr:hypothetical protein M8C21_004269 [Ambrosia artemisiifolia]